MEGQRTLAGGWLVDVDDKGKAALLRCPWWVEVANNNPEPDSPSDCYDVVNCDARMRDGGYGDDTIVCEHGHEFGGMERRLAPGGPEWQREAEERYELTGAL